MIEAACKKLKIICRKNYIVKINDSKEIEADYFIEGVGGSRGMLIFSNFNRISHFTNELIILGYGYTVYSEKGMAGDFDLENFREMFRDWGWRES
jgi:hypothetical protein